MTGEINPSIGAMLRSARDWLAHEHSLFRSLNLEPILIGKGKATFSVDLPKEFAGPDGKIHGGLLTIIMDSIFGLTVFTRIEEVKPIATINLRSDYFDHASPGVRAICAAQCLSIADEVAFVTGDIKTETHNTLLATGAGSFLVGTRGFAKGSRL